jgi:hypothetical protein
MMFDFSARVIGPWESGAGQFYENPVSTPFIKQKNEKAIVKLNKKIFKKKKKHHK